MAQFLGVNGVARLVWKEYRGVDGVARQVNRAYRGVLNVARRYLENFSIRFNKPSSSGRATATKEFSGFDKDCIRMMFENAVINSGKSEFICRMYIYIDKSYEGKTLQFDYSLSGGSSGYLTREVLYRKGDNVTLAKHSLVNTEGVTYTATIPTGCEFIVIGFWGGRNNYSGELVMRNMFLGGERII